MGSLIDSCLLIELERSSCDPTEHVLSRKEEMFLSVISAGELLHGVPGAVDPTTKARRLAFAEGAGGFPGIAD